MKSFSNKMLAKLLFVISLVFFISGMIVIYKIEKIEEKSARKDLNKTAALEASEIQKFISQGIYSVELFANQITGGKELEDGLNPELFVSQLKRSLALEENFLGYFFKTKNPRFLTAKFGEKENQNPKYYDKTGVFNPYIRRKDGDISVVPSGAVYTKTNDKLYIKKPRETMKTYITKPYITKLSDGSKITALSITTPIIYKGEFQGIFGVDISLEKFVKKITSIKFYKTGYAFLLNDEGTVVAHYNKRYIGKNIVDIVKSERSKSIYRKILKLKDENKTYFYTKPNSKTGEDSLYFSQPISFENTEQKWALFFSAPIDEYLEPANNIRNTIIISFVISFIILLVMSIFIVRRLNYNLVHIKDGLVSFFSFLNKESSQTKEITIKSNDEFGEMSTLINSNVKKIESTIITDDEIIGDIKNILDDVSKGKLDNRISKSTNTENLMQLKEVLNIMLDKLENLLGQDINEVFNLLEQYSNQDFTKTLANDSVIAKNLSKLQGIISQILKDSKKNSLELNESSKDVLSKMSILNKNATSQAASLEEVAASIEEITGNIRNTNAKSQEMTNISNTSKQKAQEGKKLATKTVQSMDEINEEVNSINEAITVIDQIAFQTNILSLNAAVEAATAGEAGKGFAVVAQEVRNLASRSAEAAKEIKDLVETATLKANNGKQISSSMIEGYTELEDIISQTNELISDVSTASKEQSIGMIQISDTMNQLDKFTQQNASVVYDTNNIVNSNSQVATRTLELILKNKF